MIQASRREHSNGKRLSRAGETLPDRRRFDLDAGQWAAFQAALDTPAADSPRLRRLLREPSVFEADPPA